MIYRVSCPPSGAPLPKLRRFEPPRALHPLVSGLLATQAFTLIALWVAFVGIVTMRFSTTKLSDCGCVPTLVCLLR